MPRSSTLRRSGRNGSQEQPNRGSLLGAARAAREEQAPPTPAPVPPVPAKPSPEVVIQRWTAEHQRQLVAVQAKARRVMGHAEGMRRRHVGKVQDPSASDRCCHRACSRRSNRRRMRPRGRRGRRQRTCCNDAQRS